MLSIKVKKLDEDAKLPTKAYKESAGWDIYSLGDYVVESGKQVKVCTGIAWEMPNGWHAQIHTRSSFHNRNMESCLGIIDADYRGEIMVWIRNFSDVPYTIKKGDRLCQALFLPVPEVSIEEVKELAMSQRGTGGMGSSGK